MANSISAPLLLVLSVSLLLAMLDAGCTREEECRERKVLVDGRISSSSSSSSSEERRRRKEEEHCERCEVVQTPVLAMAIHPREHRRGSSSSEERREHCTFRDCHFHGTCFGPRSQTVCLCRRGFCGPLCREERCDGDRGCNGERGWCLATRESSRCVCRPGFEGEHCEREKGRRCEREHCEEERERRERREREEDERRRRRE